MCVFITLYFGYLLIKMTKICKTNMFQNTYFKMMYFVSSTTENIGNRIVSEKVMFIIQTE